MIRRPTDGRTDHEHSPRSRDRDFLGVNVEVGGPKLRETVAVAHEGEQPVVRAGRRGLLPHNAGLRPEAAGRGSEMAAASSEATP